MGNLEHRRGFMRFNATRHHNGKCYDAVDKRIIQDVDAAKNHDLTVPVKKSR